MYLFIWKYFSTRLGLFLDWTAVTTENQSIDPEKTKYF